MRLGTAAALALAVASPALAGPPYLTDDPEPTDTGHWEIYAFAAGEGRHSTVDADVGFDLNYGAVRNVQLTATLPLSFARESSEGWRSGAGDVELAVKYRFLNDEDHGFSVAVFPRVILPTSGLENDERTNVLLPVWLQKDFAGGISLFGGGGYEIHGGPGNRNLWQAGIALSYDVSEKLSAGAEINRQGADVVGGTAQTRAGLGSIVKFSDHAALLVSGGPTWAGHRAAYHLYGALGLFF